MDTHVDKETPVLDRRGSKPEQFVRSGNAVKAELRTGSNVCECTMCGLFFTGPDVFDRHLIADMKCRTPEKMRKLGMVTNEHGVWQRGTSPNKKATA